MSRASLAIRPFRFTDLEVVRRLVAEMQDYERAIDGRLIPGAEMMHAYTEAMQARCAERAGAILLAEFEGAVVGFVTVLARVPITDLDEPRGSYALVSDLVVTAAHRGQGIGRALLAAAEAHAREAGARELRITALAENGAAATLYRDAGYRPYLVTSSKSLEGEAE